MPQHTSPEVVIQRQLDAYNAKNLEAWLSTYAPNAKQFELGMVCITPATARVDA